MSARYPTHYSSRSARSNSKTSASRTSDRERHPPPKRTPPPDEYVKNFEPCATTASYFLYAQQNLILSLHHDTLAVDRRFDKHKDEVLLIFADNVSDKGAGRLVVSYDASQTAIVWDLFTGGEVARFASFETIRAAAWMRDGSIAFGNSQGAIILFDVETSEHINTRTIFDPITSLAPASDCRTFAVGYNNGSILITTLHPTFTILHTLNTNRAPSPISGLAWHGSSSKQRTDMLATQTADGILRVWSVAKAPHTDQPRVIRELDRFVDNMRNTSRNWFAWSKNGRLVNFADGEVRTWDVRTKKITSDHVPVVDRVVAISAYGPNGSLFTVSQNHEVQQHDLLSPQFPIVKRSFHVPPNAPPTPPGSTEVDKPRVVPMRQPRRLSSSSSIPIQIDTDTSGAETSEDEGPIMSPIGRMMKDTDDEEDESRDQLAPLSPVSSRASMSSASSYGRPRRSRHRNQARSERSQSSGTVFSAGTSSRQSDDDSISIRSGTSRAPTTASRQPSKLRQSTMRSPQEGKQAKLMDLFPHIKARLSEVKFKPPQYAEETSPDALRQEMLNTVFGWDEDIEELIRDEQGRHPRGTAASFLLAKWLGEDGGDPSSEIVGSATMSSSDWMLLSLSSSLGQGSQKQVVEAFVRRLLEQDEVHPAVAVLVGVGDHNEAVEVYVSRKYYMEAILLTCYCFPHDWGRQSHLVRKWGEVAVTGGQPELAVRCFSCTSIECSEPWFSPRSQDLTYQAQQQILAPDDSYQSPTSQTSPNSARMTTKNASLKLITSFGAKGEPKPENFGETPIADSAITPGTRRAGSRGFRDLSETRTATPGGYRSNRMPSASRRIDMDMNPMPDLPARRGTPAISEGGDEPLTTVTARGPYGRSRQSSRAPSEDRNKHNLSIDTGSTVGSRSHIAASVASSDTTGYRGRHRRTASSLSRAQLEEMEADDGAISPAMQSSKIRSIDKYIDSLNESNSHAQRIRAESRSRNENRSKSRPRDVSTARSDFSIGGGRARKSPTSPKSMTAEEAKPRRRDDSQSARPRAGSKMSQSRVREESPEPVTRYQSKSRNESRGPTRRKTPEQQEDDYRSTGYKRQSPVSPAAMEPPPLSTRGGQRERSTSRRPTPLAVEGESRTRSTSRRPQERQPSVHDQEALPGMLEGDRESRHGRSLSRKELAAQELEARRLSLARRPSAPAIPQPSQDSYGGRPGLSPRSATESDMLTGRAFGDRFDTYRSQTVDPEAMFRHNESNAGSTHRAPFGLPSTPKAMRRQDTLGSDVPSVPKIPQTFDTLGSTSYQPASQSNEASLLPSTVYTAPRAPPSRSASAPPEKMFGGNGSPAKHSSPISNRFRRDSNSRRDSGGRRDSAASLRGSPRASGVQQSRLPSGDYSHNTFLDTSADDGNIVIVPETEPPPMLAELAHLAGPPPPPPPPAMFSSQQPPSPPPQQQYRSHSQSQSQSQGYIQGMPISLPTHHQHQQSYSAHPDLQTSPQDIGMAPLPLTTQNLTRRNASQATSATTAGEPNSPPTGAGSTASRWGRLGEKMRSQSRSRNAGREKKEKESPGGYDAHQQGGSPYETLLPNVAFQRAKSPYETVYDEPEQRSYGASYMDREYRRPSGGRSTSGDVQTRPPMGRQGSGGVQTTGGSTMRNPKEIRAGMTGV